MPQGSVRRGWAATWPMASLCILASSRWLLESARPEMQSSDLTEAVGYFLAACFAASLTLIFRPVSRPAGRFGESRGTLVGEVAILTGPVLAALISNRYVNANDATLALSLTPVVVAVASAALGSTGGPDLTARLWPGLAGVAGLLLLLPQPSLSDWRADLAMAGMPLLAGTGAVLARRQLGDPASRAINKRWIFPWQASALIVAGAILGGLGLHAQRTRGVLAFSMDAAVLDGLLALLTLIIVRRLGAVRWSAQFLLVPLGTLLEGALLLHPMLDLRSWVGFTLLLVSGGYLLLVGGEGGYAAP